MKKFKVCLAVLVIAMMMGGSVYAFDRTDHVKVAPNGKGDLLIFPWYFAMPGGYDTKISVINTSNDRNVVAKVVYRSFAWSTELLDHLIYLSPNDVWTGRLVNVGGVAMLQCDDDSMLGRFVSGAATDADFANVTPVRQPLGTAYCAAGDTNTFGYIEVIEAASILTKADVKVAKKDIYNWYAQLLTVGQNLPSNVLTGYQENFIGLTSTLKRAVVFADYKNTALLSSAIESFLGQNANNTLAELEAAMGKYDVGLPYVAKQNGDMSMHIFNFPTKESMLYSSGCSSAASYRYNSSSPYWSSVYYQCETYTRNTYDLMENGGIGQIFSPASGAATMCEEVHLNFTNYSAAAAAYTEGWIRYNWGKSKKTSYGIEQSGLPISFTGTPVLASVLYWTDLGGNWAEADASYTDGVVKENSVSLKYYHYSH